MNGQKALVTLAGLGLLFALLGSAGQAAVDASPLRLVTNGKSSYAIGISSQACEVEQFAAEELQKYISLISGAKLPIEEDCSKDKAILVGNQFVDRKDLGEDGFIIRTEKERIILGGNSPRATLYSVYGFLEKYLGCGWCIPGDDTVPESRTIAVSAIDDVEKPAFSYRAIVNFPYTAQRAVKELDWMAKNRINWSHVATNGPILWGRENSRETFIPELKKRGLHLQFGGHTFFTWVPPSRYFAAHPEYYSLIKGKRAPYSLCVSNPEVVLAAAENIKQFIKENPEMDVIDLWIEDREHWCDCADCRAIDGEKHSLYWDFDQARLKEGFPKPARLYSRSKSCLLFVNKVAKEVAKEHPKVMLNFLAYANLCDPPEDVSVGENVLVGFAGLPRHWSGPMNSPDIPLHKAYSSAIEAWAKKTKNLYIYDYYGQYIGYEQAAVAPIIQGDLNYYRQLGIDKMSSESANWYNPGRVYMPVNLYVYARLVWNPDVKWQEVVEDFCRYYGKAASPMTRHWLRIQEETRSAEQCRSEYLADIEEAKSLAENETIRTRIQLVKDAWKQAARDRARRN